MKKMSRCRILLACAILVMVTAIALFFYNRTGPQKKITHVVLISIDTCRADHLGCYGYLRKTSPNIDAVAAEGIMFKHVVTSVPITLPAHSSMLTGTIPIYHGVRDNNNYQLSDSSLTVAEILRQHEFVTGAVIGAFVLDSQFGLDQGFDFYDDKIDWGGKKLFMYSERKAEEVTRSANIWLEENKDKKSFLFLHYFDPHSPYKSHERFRFGSGFDPNSQIDGYDSEIAYTDYCIGQVIDKLKELSLYDSTLLIITADHGEGLGQHNEISHGFFIYYSTLHVPLIIKIPTGPKGKQINNLVGLIDILPTICDSLGIDVPKHIQGQSLYNFIFDEKTSSEERNILCESLIATKFELAPLYGLVSNRWHYIHTSTPELYNLKRDRYETKNRFQFRPRQAQIMQDKLNLTLKNSRSLNQPDTKIMLNEQTKKRLQSLGYISDLTVDETIQPDQSSLDMKDFIEVYNFYSNFLGLGTEGKFDEAKKLANDFLTKRGDTKFVYYWLGSLALGESDFETAITHFSRCLELIEPGHKSPFLADTHNKLGTIYANKGKYDLAITHLTEALKAKPNHTDAINNLAWIKATCEKPVFRDPDEALQLAKRVCELTDHNRPNYLDTLAAAYAAAERFPNAVKTAEKAIDLAESGSDQQLASEIKKHLEFYKEYKPYIESVQTELNLTF